MNGNDALHAVMTATEAAKRWGKSDITIRQACSGYKKSAPRFLTDEARRSGSTWLVTVEGMTRVFGPEPTNTAER